MARFGGNKNKDESSDNVFSTDEITNEVINTDNNENEDSPVSEVTDEIKENPSEVSDETPSEVTEEKRDPRIQIEDIPSFDEIPATSAPLAHGLLLQIVAFRNSYLDNIETLQAASFNGSEENVLEMADKYKDRDVFLPNLIEAFNLAKKAYESAFEELTKATKTAANVKSLSDTERAEYVGKTKELAASINNALANMVQFESMNPFGSIKPAIEWANNLPELPGVTKSGAGKPVKLGTSVSRPRLGPGGYIKIEDKTYDSFSKALPTITAKTKRESVSAPEVHRAWFDAAKVNEWSEVPVDKEITFDFFGIEITIVRKAA